MVIDRIIRYWWVYVLLFLTFVAAEILVEEYGLQWVMFQDALFYGIIAVALLLFVAWILALYRKRYWLSGGIFVSGLVCIAATVYMCIVILAHVDTSDSFGKDHPIPEGMGYHETKETFCEEDIDSTDVSTWLRVHDEFQPGIYEYQYFSSALPDGYIYLKCFEATENIPLSEDRIALKTKTTVDHHMAFGPVGGYHVFTVYEGDWGDYYVVRVEVWHHDTSTGSEHKVNEKIYRMQGWQR